MYFPGLHLVLCSVALNDAEGGKAAFHAMLDVEPPTFHQDITIDDVSFVLAINIVCHPCSFYSAGSAISRCGRMWELGERYYSGRALSQRAVYRAPCSELINYL